MFRIKMSLKTWETDNRNLGRQPNLTVTDLKGFLNKNKNTKNKQKLKDFQSFNIGVKDLLSKIVNWL